LGLGMVVDGMVCFFVILSQKSRLACRLFRLEEALCSCILVKPLFWFLVTSDTNWHTMVKSSV
jgi:hypothetical protein